MKDFLKFIKYQNTYIPLDEVSTIIKRYCKNYLEYKKLKYFFNIKKKYFVWCFKNISKIIERNNNKFYKKNISNNIFDNINGHSLDYEQRMAVLTDENSYLVVAGAGSGKTLTMIGKIRYLIEINKINPLEILCISFTNLSADSIKTAIYKNYKYNIEVYTFHKLANKILHKAGVNKSICDSNLLTSTILEYLYKNLLENEYLLDQFIKYFLLEKIHFKLDSNYNSNEELLIGNYLIYLNILFEYKIMLLYNNKPIKAFYLPKYNFYIIYYNNIEKIEEIRNMYMCKVYEIYSFYFTEGTIFEVIDDIIKSNNIRFKKKNNKMLFKIYGGKSNIFKNLSKTIFSFINLLKTNNFDNKKIYEIEKCVNKISNKIEKNKNMTILKIIENIYYKYEAKLSENKEIDFNDMISLATTMVINNKVKLNYKYIIIDEYQDTSYCRYQLIKSIKDKTNSKLICVGDDFQSIYRFTGCDIKMFLNFKDMFQDSKILYINNTYRNSQELINLAGNFIMKNKMQLKKKLKSSKKINKPVKIYLYYNKNEIINLFEHIEEKSVYVLGRNNSDVEYLNNKEFNSEKDNIYYKDKIIKFYSVHKSKGLESDAVVIVNLEDKILGFPSKCEENNLLKYLSNINENFEFDEERRLFYVALTRTKGNVYLFVPKKNRSIFVNEIVKESQKFIEFLN